MGLMWILGTLFTVYHVHEELGLFTPRDRKQLRHYLVVLVSLSMGLLFLYFGKIKTTIFDKT